MKTLKNKKFEFIKLSKNENENDFKNAILFMVRKGDTKGFNFGMIEKRMDLIDSLKACKDEIKLEKADWKHLKEIAENSTWFEGVEIVSDNAMKEIFEMLKQIKNIL